MSELKVNTISEVTGANGVVIDSVKLKDGEVYATKIQYTDGDDAITIADGGGITVAQAATFSSTIGSGNITSTGTIQGTSITATTAFVPDASDGAALGTTALEFSDLFLADAAVIALGDDQDVTLTHVADTGILLNSTNVIQFNDASQNIGAPSATVLDINATDEIELNATLVDINANVEISGTATTTGVHTFTAVPVFPNNTIETADIQDDAITNAKIAADQIDSGHIADDQIDSEHYVDGSIDTAHIADGQVTIGKLATAVLTGATDIGAAIVDADLLLVDDGAGGTLRKTAASRLKTYIGSNTPAFLAYANADQGSISQNTYTKLTNYGAEVFDTDNAFASSRFTPGVVGKYFIYGTVYGTAADGTRNFLSVYLNGSTHYQTSTHIPGGNNNFAQQVTAMVNVTATDDYIELFFNSTGQAATAYSSGVQVKFGGFKLIA